MALVLFFGIVPLGRLQSVAAGSEETLYYTYVRDKLKRSDPAQFPGGDYKKALGVFSVLVDDMDSDGKKEMLTFSLEERKESYQGNYYSLLIKLYRIENGAVKYCGKSEAETTDGAGVFETKLCVTYENKTVKIYYFGMNFGGSMIHEHYKDYKVKNKKLKLCHNFTMSEFYRYDSYEYHETVSNKTYNSYEALERAAANAGFKKTVHYHQSYEDEKFDPKTSKDVRGTHVFALRHAEYSYPNEIGFLYDNTNLKKNLPKKTIDLSKAAVKLSKTVFTYDGAKKQPRVTVTYQNKTLKAGTDYKVSFSNANAVGKATAVVRGMGSYSGTVKKTYTIRPAAPRITLTSPRAKRMTVQYPAVPGATGYQLQYKREGAETFHVRNVTTLQWTWNDLPVGAVYVFRVRAFAKAGKTMTYGPFCAEQKITVRG